MYAVIKSGGKQYRVSPEQTLKVETLPVEAGEAVEIKDVLMIVDGDKTTVGTPVVAGAVVKAEVVRHGRGKKVKIIKFKRRKHHMKRMGHRQNFTEIKIVDIKAA